MTITVAEICRYPVKGLNAERLARVARPPLRPRPRLHRLGRVRLGGRGDAKSAARASASSGAPNAARRPTWIRKRRLRDMNVPQALKRGFGHVDMEVYAEVVTGGEVATGDRTDAPERGV